MPSFFVFCSKEVAFFKRKAQVMYTVENFDVSRKQAVATNTSCGNATVVINKARNNDEDYQNCSLLEFSYNSQ